MGARSIIKPLTGSFTGTGQSASRGFQGSAFLQLDGDGSADMTVAFEYSDDDGNSWHGMSIDPAGTPASWAIGNGDSVGLYVDNEIPGRIFRFNCTAFTDGEVAYDLKSRG